MNCPSCATFTRDGARFCPRCGLWLDSDCPRCGSALSERAIFCDRCGTQVSAWPGAATLPASFTPAGAEPALPPRLPQPTPTPDEARAPRLSSIPRALAAKLEAARASGEMVGERRIVTMLFCDVKGSTEAAERLDPEDWTEIMNGAFEHMIRPIYTYEGTLARLMGDALLAFFGAPIAHEDDPQRAVLAALDIVRAMEAYREPLRQRWDLDLKVRVGINTGLVVVGAVGSDLRVEYSALGDAINLAARMEQTALPGTVQIAHDTYRHVKPLFEFEALGGIEVKGKSEPVLAYRVLGRKAAAGRARGIEGLQAEMVGREAELLALRTVLADLKQGVGGIVCVLGEAGLGKSRLVSEARQAFNRPDSPSGEWHETGSLSYESSQAYGLFQRLLRRVLALDYHTPAPRVREQLAALVGGLPAERQAGALLAFEALFGLAHTPGQAPLAGEAFQRELYEALRAWWQTRWARQPAVLVFDDMHWSDAASVELLRKLLPLTEAIPVVVLCVLRAERQTPAWQIKTTADDELRHRYTEVALRPLSPAESSELVNRLLAIADLPDRLRASILEKTGGNPFFVEEVVRTLIDSGAVVAEERGADGRAQRYWRASNPGADFAIPDNLQSLMAARMDRLEEETRSTLQLASVIGRSFYYRVLARLSTEGPTAVADLDRHLGVLVRTEMIQEAARVPEVEYKFRNPLMQEATYRTILLKRRREFHQRVGTAMEALFADRLTELAPRLGFHFAEGGDSQRALHYFTLAGDRAAHLYANQEALAHYERAIELATATSAGAAAPVLIHLFTSQGRVLELNAQYTEALQLYQRLEALAGERGEPRLELAALLAQGTLVSTANTQFDPLRAVSLAQRGQDLARALGDGAAEAKLAWNLLNIHRFTDHGPEAIAAGERSLALARELGLVEQMGYTLNDLFYVYQAQGQLAQGLAANREARDIWRELDNRAMLADNLSAAVVFEVFSGNLEGAIANSAEALAMTRAIGNSWGIAFSQMGVAIAYWMQGDFDQAIVAMQTTIHYGELAGFLIGPLWARAQLALVYCRLGQPERGLALADEMRDYVPSMSTSSPAMASPAMAVLHSYTVHAYLAAGEVEKAAAFLGPAPAIPQNAGMPDEMLGWARAALLLAQGNLELAGQWAEQMAEVMRATHTELLLAEMLLILGRAQVGWGDAEAARATLHAARAAAEALQLRWAWWQILADLAPLEQAAGHPAEARALLRQARDLIDYIANHVGAEDLQASFLARSDVRAVMEAEN